MNMPIDGAKLALFIGDKLAVILRDCRCINLGCWAILSKGPPAYCAGGVDEPQEEPVRRGVSPVNLIPLWREFT